MKFNKFMSIMAFIFLLIFIILACFIMNYNNKISNMKEENEKILENYVMNDSFKNEISNMKNKYKELLEKINKLNEKYDSIKQFNVNKKEEIYKIENETTKQKKDLFNQVNGIIHLESNIVSLNSIEFILDYIKRNDNEFIFKKINLLYRATRDGDNAINFDNLCNNKLNILIIIKTYDNYIFGGYSKIGLKELKEIEDNNSFLFSIDNRKIYPIIKGIKMKFYLYSVDSGIILFDNLFIYNNFLNRDYNFISKKLKTIFNGLKYEFEMNGDKEFFQCKELEVFQLSL